MVSNDEIADGYSYTVKENFRAYISEIYEYEHYGDKIFTDDLKDLQEYYYNYFLDKEEKEIYEKNISNNELYKLAVINEQRTLLQELLEGE